MASGAQGRRHDARCDARPGPSESIHGPDSGSRKTGSSTYLMVAFCATPPTGSPEREGQCRSRRFSTGGRSPCWATRRWQIDHAERGSRPRGVATRAL